MCDAVAAPLTQQLMFTADKQMLGAWITWLILELSGLYSWPQHRYWQVLMTSYTTCKHLYHLLFEHIHNVSPSVPDSLRSFVS